MDESQVVVALSALSHETRLRVIRYLVKTGADGKPAGEIAEAMGASPSKISFHLAALERSGIVSSERVSRQIVYRADFEQLGALMNYLLADCCQNSPTVLACCDMPGNSVCN